LVETGLYQKGRDDISRFTSLDPDFRSYKDVREAIDQTLEKYDL
jgi:hypothetical protein